MARRREIKGRMDVVKEEKLETRGGQWAARRGGKYRRKGGKEGIKDMNGGKGKEGERARRQRRERREEAREGEEVTNADGG